MTNTFADNVKMNENLTVKNTITCANGVIDTINTNNIIIVTDSGNVDPTKFIIKKHSDNLGVFMGKRNNEKLMLFLEDDNAKGIVPSLRLEVELISAKNIQTNLDFISRGVNLTTEINNLKALL